MSTIKVYPREVYDSVENLVANRPILQGWACEHAGGAAPKAQNAIAFAPKLWNNWFLRKIFVYLVCNG
jgi:hypothetical protein